MFNRLGVLQSSLTGVSPRASAGGGGARGVTYNINDVDGGVITDPEGTLYDDGGPDGPYGTASYQTTIQAAAGTQIRVTLTQFEMGDSAGYGGRSGYEKLRIFDGQEGLRVYYGSGTTGDVVLGEQTTTWIGGSLWISFGNAGKYGIGGQFGTDDAGFALSWETI